MKVTERKMAAMLQVANSKSSWAGTAPTECSNYSRHFTSILSVGDRAVNSDQGTIRSFAFLRWAHFVHILSNGLRLTWRQAINDYCPSKSRRGPEAAVITVILQLRSSHGRLLPYVRNSRTITEKKGLDPQKPGNPRAEMDTVLRIPGETLRNPWKRLQRLRKSCGIFSQFLSVLDLKIWPSAALLSNWSVTVFHWVY